MILSEEILVSLFLVSLLLLQLTSSALQKLDALSQNVPFFGDGFHLRLPDNLSFLKLGDLLLKVDFPRSCIGLLNLNLAYPLLRFLRVLVNAFVTGRVQVVLFQLSELHFSNSVNSII